MGKENNIIARNGIFLNVLTDLAYSEILQILPKEYLQKKFFKFYEFL